MKAVFGVFISLLFIFSANLVAPTSLRARQGDNDNAKDTQPASKPSGKLLEQGNENDDFAKALKQFEEELKTFLTEQSVQANKSYVLQLANEDIVNKQSNLDNATQLEDKAKKAAEGAAGDTTAEAAEALALANKNYADALLQKAKSTQTQAQIDSRVENGTFNQKKDRYEQKRSAVISASSKVNSAKTVDRSKAPSGLSSKTEEAEKAADVAEDKLIDATRKYAQAVWTQRKIEDELAVLKAYITTLSTGPKREFDKIKLKLDEELGKAKIAEPEAKGKLDEAVVKKVQADIKAAQFVHQLSLYDLPWVGNQLLCGTSEKYGNPEEALAILQKGISLKLSKVDQEKCRIYFSNGNLTLRVIGETKTFKVTRDIAKLRGNDFCIATPRKPCYAFILIHYAIDPNVEGTKEVDMIQTKYYFHNSQILGEDYVRDSYPYLKLEE